MAKFINQKNMQIVNPLNKQIIYANKNMHNNTCTMCAMVQYYGIVPTTQINNQAKSSKANNWKGEKD